LKVYSLRAGLENAHGNFIWDGLLSVAARNLQVLGFQNLVGIFCSAIICRLCILHGTRQEQFQHPTQVHQPGRHSKLSFPTQEEK
jgi:hypothetical protein